MNPHLTPHFTTGNTMHSIIEFDLKSSVQNKFHLISNFTKIIGPLGVYVYIIGFAFPLRWDITFFFVIATSILSVFIGPRKAYAIIPQIPLQLISLFLFSMTFSIFFSEDIGRSLRLSTSFLPALLIFFVIVTEFET